MKIFLVIFCICIAIISWGQQYNIKNLDMNDGLPAAIVNAVAIDQDGYIWFATQNGVCYYDGSKMNTVEVDKNIKGIDFNSIYADSKNAVWVGTTNYGVYKIEGTTTTNYSTHNGLPNEYVNGIFEDNENKIWVSTDGGIVFYDGTNFNSFIDPENLLEKTIYYATQSDDGALWFGVVNFGLIHYQNKKFSYFSEKEIGIENASIFTITSEQNKTYIGTDGDGLFYYDGEVFSKIKIPEIEYSWVSKTIIKENYIVIICDQGLVFYYNDEKYEIISESNGLLSNDLYNGVFDLNDNLWLSNGNGVSVLRNEDIQSFITEDGLNSDNISSIYYDGELIYLGTSSKGVNILNQKKLTFESINIESLINTNITAFHKSENKLWIGGAVFSEGILVLEKDEENKWKQKSIKTINEKPIITTTGIKKDLNGDLWIATFGSGLFKISSTDTLHLSVDNILSSDKILDLYLDQNNNAWISLYNDGVYLYDGKELTSINEKYNINEINTEVVNGEKNGKVYFGNKSSGLTILYNGKTKTFTTKDGLLSNSITAIVFDDLNNIWIGTEKGINKIKIDENFNLISLESITETNGLISNQIVKNGLKIIDNYLWAATNKGLAKVNLIPKTNTRNPSKIVLNDIRLFFEKVNWNKYEKFKLDRFGVPKELILEYNQNHLTFSFNTLSINTQEYSTKLEGWDNDWSPYSPNSEAVYSNLQPGVYTLKVKSRDNYGIESENILEFSVTITPPFWQTWWFRITVLVFIIGMLYLLFKLRTAALLKRQQELEATVEERTREVVEEKKQVEYQKHLVDEKNQEISDSINYAERIQRAMLANHKLLDEFFNEYFVFFQPKDVVSGDFYWASKLANGDLAIVNADSTGHGVPGAIMSMLNMNSLKEAVVGKEISEPHDILTYTRKVIKETLMNDGSAEGGKDGMDCSLLCFSKNSPTIKFAAANNPVWVVRTSENNEKEFIEFKPDKMPVGKHDRDHEPFNLQEFEYQKGDVIYTLTDGMPDQFGGPKGKKYMYKKLKTFLTEISELPMEEQKEKIHAEFMNWMQSEEQVDDVCIIGVRV